MQERRTVLKDRIHQYAKDEHKAYVDVLGNKVSEALKFCDGLGDESLSQSKLWRTQQYSKKLQRDVDHCIDGINTLGGVTFTFSSNHVLEVINEFGKLHKADQEGNIDRDNQHMDGHTPGKCDNPDVRPKTPGNTGQDAAQSIVPRPPPPSLEKRQINAIGTSVKKCVGRKGSGPGEFSNPTAVAVSPVTGNIIVTDTGNKRLQVFDETGEPLRVITGPPNRLFRYTGTVTWVAVSPKGQVFILSSDTRDGTCIVFIFTEDGLFIRQFNIPLSDASSLVVDSQHRVHVSCGTHGVYVYDDTGKELARYGHLSTMKIEAKRVAICLDSFAVIDVVDERYGKTDYKKRTFKIYKFNAQLQYTGKLQYVDPERFHEDNCQYVGSIKFVERNIIIANRVCDKICIMNDTFKLLRSYGRAGQAVGELYHPRDVAVTPGGDIVVVGENNFMQFF